MMITPLDNASPKLQTLDEYIHGELHRIFLHVADVLGSELEADELPGVPWMIFKAELYMCAAWDKFITSKGNDGSPIA